MSRVSYSDEPNIFWGGWAKRALGGKRGQSVLAEMEQALLSMPNKRLIANEWAYGGDVCLLGSLDVYRTSVTLGVPWERAETLVEEPPEPLMSWDFDYPLVGLLGYRPWLIRSYALRTPDRPWKSRVNVFTHVLDQGERRRLQWPDSGYDEDEASERLNLSRVFAWTAIEHNDEQWANLSPETRWKRALDWVRACQANPQRAYLL